MQISSMVRKQRAQTLYAAALTEELLLAHLAQRFKPSGGGRDVGKEKLAAALVLARDYSLVPGTFIVDVGLPEGSRTRVQKYRDIIRAENLLAATTAPAIMPSTIESTVVSPCVSPTAFGGGCPRTESHVVV